MSKQRFNELDALRTSFIKRCERYADWTLPAAFPACGTTDTDEMFTDFQSHGAKVTNSLSNKLSIALFAPSRPFFKLKIGDDVRKTLMEKHNLDAPTIDVTLSLAAKSGMGEVEKANARPTLIRAMKLLIITGNALIMQSGKDKDIRLRTYSVRNYVVVRDVDGNVIELITRDTSLLKNMPQQVQDAYRSQVEVKSEDAKVSLFVCCVWDGVRKAWDCKQYVEDIEMLGSYSSYAKDDFPYAVLVWELADGRHYGDGLVEQHQGDFHGLSTLSAAFIAGLGEMCRIVHLVNPTSTLNPSEYASAVSGACLPGKEGDVVTPDLGGKVRDFAIVDSKINKYERTLSEAFLYAQNAVRDAERVTAEEVRMIERELETAFGGIYSQLANDLQSWLANLIIKRMKLPFSDITPVISTGVDAMSANGDLENLQLLLQDLSGAAAMPEGVQERLDWGGLIKVLASYRQVEFYKFLKSEDVVKKEQQARLQQAQQAQANMANSQEQARAKGQIAVNQVANQQGNSNG